jgi:hypothetical protein
MLYNKQAYASFIRSKAKYIEQDERSTAYFIQLETHRQIANSIQKLVDHNGLEANTDNEILNMCEQFYENLYNKRMNQESENITNYLEKINVPYKLSKQDNEIFSTPIQNKDCIDVINNLKTNRSPGSDGLPAEF